VGVRSLLGRLVGSNGSLGEPLLQEVRAGGGPFERVVFTRNRRVMVSVADGGRTLRVHESFRGAPPEVARAIGAMYGRASHAGRERARVVVRDFLRQRPPAPVGPRRRRLGAGDRPHLERLAAEFARVNDAHFQGALPEVPLWLSGRMRSRNGHFSVQPLEIVISRRLCTHGEPGEAERTLRHEMIHLWQHAQGGRPDHGAEFRAWARRLDVHPRATREVRWLTP
jgi:hypothetical protein